MYIFYFYFFYFFASSVDFPFFFWRVSSEGGFSPLFSFLHWVPVCQNVLLIPLVGPDIPCTIGKDGGFIRRDSSFHLPKIDLARAGRCVTDTLSKRFMSVHTLTDLEKFPVRISKMKLRRHCQ